MCLADRNLQLHFVQYDQEIGSEMLRFIVCSVLYTIVPANESVKILSPCCKKLNVSINTASYFT